MEKFTANYCHTNSNFVITNLPIRQSLTPYTNIIKIIQNIVMRGCPTIASAYLRKELKLDRNYLSFLKAVKFLSKDNLDWTRTIKGDTKNNDYPAAQFYDDLGLILNSAGFIRNLTIAEYPISSIIPEMTKAFAKQDVDFYIPILKTVIEVDGVHHNDQTNLDAERDKAFERFGIKTIRISTNEIRNKNYDRFILQFREVYKMNMVKINEYNMFIESDWKEYVTQIKLTSIIRFQVLILELIDRGVISFEDKYWNFNVFAIDAKQYLELAFKDLELWITHTSALFNTSFEMPNVNINVYEEESHFLRHTNSVNIKVDIFKRWDDSIKELDVYHIRTDFDDSANYFQVKTNEPIVYSLKLNTHRKHLEFLLDNLFDHKKFNDGQIEIIINCLNGEDTIGLLPTGGGKSLTYQLCIMLQPAISFVVVPIKALMLDQINNLSSKHGITHASYINGDLTPEESSKRLRDFSNGKYFLLIISPERFQSKIFREEMSLVNRVKALSIAVIDEVHCLSEWGHDFRTSYLALANTIRNIAPASRFLALTATASSKVLQDIMNELEIENHNIITISRFTRPELKFDIIRVGKSNKNQMLIDLLSKKRTTDVSDQKKNVNLIFTQTVNGKNGCFELHHFIKERTNLVTAFYSGSAPWEFLKNSKEPYVDYKDRVQKQFMRDEIDVLVATKAFGMGIDKGNIRMTVHYGIPNSLESFYQEAGRAGRDRKESNCIALYYPDNLNEKQVQTIFGINTNLSSLNAEKKNIRGDLSTLLFFLASNLTDIEEEVNLIYTFYNLISEKNDYELLVNFNNDIDQGTQEKSIYRLALLGIVEDWTINWKNRQLEIVLAEWTEQTAMDCLTKYIKKYDYTFTLDRNAQHSEIYAELIDHFYNSETPFLKRILYVLLKWYNDNVVYSRKRSMLLMKQYADNFTDSKTLQQNIEIYFKRNNDVYILEKIVGKKEKLRDWNKIFFVEEEGKDIKLRDSSTFKSLKITVSRFLESYKNDIALNLVESLLSLVEGRFEGVDGRERMSLAIREIVKLDAVERDEMLQSILVTSDQLLTITKKNLLSEVLIDNGFNKMNELRAIYSTFEDEFSYASMFKVLNTNIKQISTGGYPWET